MALDNVYIVVRREWDECTIVAVFKYSEDATVYCDVLNEVKSGYEIVTLPLRTGVVIKNP